MPALRFHGTGRVTFIKEIKPLARVTWLQCDLGLLALEVLLHLQLLEHP